VVDKRGQEVRGPLVRKKEKTQDAFDVREGPGIQRRRGEHDATRRDDW